MRLRIASLSILALAGLPVQGRLCYQFSDAQSGQPPTIVATLGIADIPAGIPGPAGTYTAIFSSTVKMRGIDYAPANLATVVFAGATYSFSLITIAISNGPSASGPTRVRIMGVQLPPGPGVNHFDVILQGPDDRVLLPARFPRALPPAAAWKTNGGHAGSVSITHRGNTRSAYVESITSAESGNSCAVRTTDIFIGGLRDGTDRNVLNYYEFFRAAHPDSPLSSSKYFSWDGTSPDGGEMLPAFITQLPAGTIVNLIGHSYGGDTAARVAAHSSRQIHLLITIDPVGGRSVPDFPNPSVRRRPSTPGWPGILLPLFKSLRPIVAMWVDVNANPAADDPSDEVADAGGKWNALPDAPVRYDDIYIPARGCHHAEFSKMMIFKGTTGKSAEDILLGR
jgi:hypothetical protein